MAQADEKGLSSMPADPVRPGAISALLQELFATERTAQQASWARPLEPGTIVGRFELVREIGRGGFGVVYEAKDRELGRTVAFKAVLAGNRPEVREDRLLREAEAAARLSHPNIVTIHDVGRSELGPYMILELLQGETLARRLERGPVGVHDALRIGIEVGKGLAHAHARGVVHRDLTPGNIFLCADGQVKVLDLGMAHAFGRRKMEGGTPAYMAPEQLSGAPEDERTDVFALGVILYRMLAGRLPFANGSGRPLLGSSRPPALHVREKPALGELVSSMLSKDPLKRPRDAGAVLAALQRLERELLSGTGPGPLPASRSRSRWVLVAAAAVVVLAVAAWFAHRESRIRWALQEAMPRIAELIEAGRYSEAFALAERTERVVPHDPQLAKLWPQFSIRATIQTTPEGADVQIREYSAPDTAWRHIGRTPVTVRLPFALHRLRLEKDGYAPVEAVPRLGPTDLTMYSAAELREGRALLLRDFVLHGSRGSKNVTVRLALDPAGSIPSDMVHVPGGRAALDLFMLDQVPPVQLGDYLIDRTEVTNRAFKRFVEAGGYRRRELWHQGFMEDGRVLSWEEAMALFRDRSGRPGPATWESGDYPEGQGDLPVTGVSWYEAAAYAAFSGKALPNLFQWSRAAGTWAAAQIVPASNFGDKELAPVRSYPGIGPFGTYDMAGNAKEWCWNANGRGGRYVLGGAWNEPSYMFNFQESLSPFARLPNVGFRLVKPLDGNTEPAASAPVPLPVRVRDFAHEKPVGPELFPMLKRLYAYDKAPLDARIEAVDDSSDRWRKEKVSFAAAYGGERVVAYLFTPRHGAPPYQTVVFFPGASALIQRSSEHLALMRFVSPVVSSGRAVLYPVYKSTYERGDGLESPISMPTTLYRDHVIAWSKDLGRSIDYVETRKDLDARRVALYGVSWGAKLAPLLAAVEDRVKASILVGGGLGIYSSMPEADPFNFARFARQPALMINGRYDQIFPVPTSQVPLFQLLGSPARDKRHVIVDAGALPPNDSVTKEVLDWLDRYLGVVGESTTAATPSSFSTHR